MDCMPLISVIVPVYNVEKYLDRCVQSIVEQTYSNLEIILVDDGSPDNCGAMCDAWAKKDSRIKVIHQKNGGSAQARNVGLDCTTGDYIGFVDSDDFIHPEMYTRLHETILAKHSDVVECNYETVSSDSVLQTECNQQQEVVLNTEAALRANIQDKICRQLVWNKLYCKFVVDNVRFTEGRFIDDEFFTYKALGNAKKVVVIPDKLYCYRQQLDSVMHQTYSLKRLDALVAKQQRLEYLKIYYPTLVNVARIDLLFSCMYAMQMSLRHLQRKELFEAKKAIGNTWRQSKGALKMSLKQRVWYMLACISLEGTCRLRNLLKIGF